jgi:hypothetical protein
MALLPPTRKIGLSRLSSRSFQFLNSPADRSNGVRTFGPSCDQRRLQSLLKLEFAPIPFLVFW